MALFGKKPTNSLDKIIYEQRIREQQTAREAAKRRIEPNKKNMKRR